ncbi:hypothetical protein [Marinobacter sp. SS5-14b]|uniref:hypothetical protein n=1 Tax=Marinobacter sp. SS5-14b TaxID=3050456 RepID=UPI0026E016A3|nr:hypothetical protein [Marinobacter sp. SS5-14b]
METIVISKAAGPILFLGSMNAMPMMYALELRERGYDVVYFVDAPKSDELHRPENHFPQISYPYPEWIVEFPLKSQMFLPYFRSFFAWLVLKKLSAIRKQKPQSIVANGFFVSILPFFPKSISKIALSHGSDLDTWADTENAQKLSCSFGKQSFYKFIPAAAVKKLIPFVVKRQFFGFYSTSSVVYFPRGFNSTGDEIISKLIDKGVNYVPRHDISFEPLANENRSFKNAGEKLIIFSGVRFNFETFYDGNDEYNKGNDIIIYGIGEYCCENRNVEIHFVRKGPDVRKAEILCDDLGIGELVVWHDEMKFYELLELYRKADICFDQVGTHWPGAIGCYALWLGKPLITNDWRLTESGAWPENSPVCSASTPGEITSWLRHLEDADFRSRISSESKVFAEKYLGPSKALNALFEFV